MTERAKVVISSILTAVVLLAIAGGYIVYRHFQGPPQSILNQIMAECLAIPLVDSTQVKIVNTWWDENESGLYHVRVHIASDLGDSNEKLRMSWDILYSCYRQGGEWSAARTGIENSHRETDGQE